MARKRFMGNVAVLVVLLLVALSSVVASCSSAAPASPTAAPSGAQTAAQPAAQAPTKEGTLKFGITTALSGSAAGWGIPLKQAAEIVFDKFNADGGVTIDGTRYKIQVVAYDDSYDMQKVVANARKLIYEDKVNFLSVLGGTSLQAIMPLVGEAKVITFGYSYLKPENKPEWHYAFVSVNPPDDASGVYKWVAANAPEVKKVAMVGRNDAVGQWSAEENVRAAKAAGLEVVATELFEPTATDYTPQLRKAMAAGAQSMNFIATNPGQIGLLVKQAREIGYKGRFDDASVGDLAASAAVAGAANFEGFIQSGAGFDQPVPQNWVDFVSRYVAKFGLPFNGSTAPRSLGPEALANALKTAKTFDTEKLISTLESSHFQTLFGDTYFFGKKKYGVNHIVTSPMSIVRYSKGVATNLDFTKPQPQE